MRHRLAGELDAAALHRAQLDGQIQLAPQAAVELPGDGHRRVGHQEGEAPLGQLREVLEDVEVGLHDLLDPRPSDLEGHFPAVGQGGEVDLRDRRRGDRLRVDRGEDLQRRPAVFLGQDRLGLGIGEGPDVVSEAGQLGGVRLRQEVGAGAEHLAELHEGRPEVLADHPQPLRPVVRRRRLLPPPRRPFDRPHEPVQMQRRDHVAESVTDQRRQNLAISRQVAQVADGLSEQRRFTPRPFESRGPSPCPPSLPAGSPAPQATAENRPWIGQTPKISPGDSCPKITDRAFTIDSPDDWGRLFQEIHVLYGWTVGIASYLPKINRE